MKALVIFGSGTDKDVYNEICKNLTIEYDLRVISAHKTPDRLDDVDLDSYDIIIAGAGLAAHLPGVVAAKTLTPVIGVPCHGNYEGLDALLSIIQMPPGVPVLAVGVNNSIEAARNANLLAKEYQGISVVGENEALQEKAAKVLSDFSVEVGTEQNGDNVNIIISPLGEQVSETAHLCIYCSSFPKGDDKAEAALNLLKHTDKGLWVGLNAMENACIAAVELLNISGKYTEELRSYRKKKGQKVIDADEEVNK